MAIKVWSLFEKFKLSELNNNFAELANRTVNGVSWGENQNISVQDSTKLPLTGGTLTGSLNFATGPLPITWGGGTYRQRINIVDDAIPGTNVFEFQQSTDSGVTYNNLFAIKDNGEIWTAKDGSYTPTASNLGEVATHICYKKNGICEYKLVAKCGTWTANVGYVIGTLDSSFRPISTFAKEVRLNDQFFGHIGISSISGRITITPGITISNSIIAIDETFISE